jgi:hypothetical protein
MPKTTDEILTLAAGLRLAGEKLKQASEALKTINDSAAASAAEAAEIAGFKAAELETLVRLRLAKLTELEKDIARIKETMNLADQIKEEHLPPGNPHDPTGI